MNAKPSMQVTIPATQAHRSFGDLIRRVFSGKEHFIIEKDGLPVAVMLSVAEYEAMLKERERQEQDKERRLKQFREAARAIGEEVAKSDLTEDELMDLLEESKQQVFEEHYGDALREKTARPR